MDPTALNKITLNTRFWDGGKDPVILVITFEQVWKYRLVIDNRYYILNFSVIDYRRCFAFNFFYRLSLFLCFLLTCNRLVESLYFTFVLVETA